MSDLGLYSVHQSEFVSWAQSYQGDRFHAVLCDPPYFISFMGKEWDSHEMSYQEWTTQWAQAVMPLLYPGALIFAFGGSRTHHRLMCGLEDAGFEIVDCIMYIFGQGFPKAQGIDRLIDRLLPDELRCSCAEFPSCDFSSNAQHASHTVASSQSDYQSGSRTYSESCSHDDGGQLPRDVNSDQLPFPLRAYAHGRNRDGQRKDVQGREQEHTLGHLSNVLLSNEDSSGHEAHQSARSRVADNTQSYISSNMQLGAGKEHGRKALRKSGKQNLGVDSAFSSFEKLYSKCLSCGKFTYPDNWKGWKTVALKPAYEVIVIARAPSGGRTYAELAMEFGSGCLNVDGGRIESSESLGRISPGIRSLTHKAHEQGCRPHNYYAHHVSHMIDNTNGLGRYPANLALNEESGALLDEMSGPTSITGNRSARSKQAVVEGTNWYVNDHQSQEYAGDRGGPSRFFYCAKSSRRERGEGNNHPCIKPLSLCRWLATLLLPPASVKPRRLLVPFAGSGSEIIGALQAGWDEVVGIDQDATYCGMVPLRVEHHLGLIAKQEDITKEKTK